MSILKGICYRIVILAMLMKLSQGSIPALGRCVEMSPETPIDIRKLVGVWYELERWSNLEEWPFKCISIKISPFFEMQSEITWMGINRYTSQTKTKTFGLRAASDANDGRLVLRSSDLDPHPKNSSIQVLLTDYKSWSIVRECNNFEGAAAHSGTLWIFTREGEPSDEVYAKIQEAVVKLNLETRRLYEVPQSQKDCNSVTSIRR